MDEPLAQLRRGVAGAHAAQGGRPGALEALLRERPAVAQQAQPDLAVGDEGAAASRIAFCKRIFQNNKNQCRNPEPHTISIPWFLSGTMRMRLPVALKNAFSTAGAATQMVGSPTPPHTLPPAGMMIDSTFGISAIRIEL